MQVSESPSSAAMELIGFQRGLEKLDYLGVKVGLIATDRSPSIKNLMKTPKYKHILHEFDAWHVGKSMTTHRLLDFSLGMSNYCFVFNCLLLFVLQM